MSRLGGVDVGQIWLLCTSQQHIISSASSSPGSKKGLCQVMMEITPAAHKNELLHTVFTSNFCDTFRLP